MSTKAVSVISSVPHSISITEHNELVSSTPPSTLDIPPVLRLKQENVSIEFDPPVEGLTGDELKDGTLYVIESVLAFISSSSSRGFQVLYPSITIHAISRSGDRSLIYCQLAQSSAENASAPVVSTNGPGADQREAEQPDEEGLMEMIEIKIIPKDPSKLDDIFETLSYCTSLHPDPNIDDDDAYGNDAFYTGGEGDFEPFTGEGDEELSEVGRAALEHLESIIVYPPGVPRPSDPSDDKDTAEEEKKPAAEEVELKP